MTSYAVRDWSNRPANPMEWTSHELSEMYVASQILLNGNAAFTPAFQEFYNEHAQIRNKIVPRVGMLHTRDNYDTTTWPWYEAEGELLDGTALQNENLRPVVRWRGSDFEVYNTDPDRVDPRVWARLVVSWCKRYGFHTVFLDYFSKRPWDYDQGQPFYGGVHLDTAWQLWQRLATREIQSHGIGVMANGRWALDEPDVVDANFTYVEKGGTLWYRPCDVARRLNTFSHGQILIDLTETTESPEQNEGYWQGVADTINATVIKTLPGGGS